MSITRRIVSTFIERPCHAWRIGGWKLRLMAVYVPLSPAIVVPLVSGKLIVGFSAPWWLIVGLVALGHLNSFTLAWLLLRRERQLSTISTTDEVVSETVS